MLHARFLIQSLLAVFCISSICAAAPVKSRDWQWWSSRLSLGVEPQVEALAHLRKYPHLDDRLREALETKDRFLAFDVIAALKRRGLLEDLVAHAGRDETGYFYLAIDSLLDVGDTTRFSALFKERLETSATAVPTKIILLDTLARMSVRLTKRQLGRFLSTETAPELRRSALSYLRAFLSDHHDTEYLELLRGVLIDRHNSDPTRLQALYLASELSSEQQQSLGTISNLCGKSYPAKIVSLCHRLAKESD